MMACLSNWLLTRYPLVSMPQYDHFVKTPSLFTFLTLIIYTHKVQKKHLHYSTIMWLYIYMYMSRSYAVRNFSFCLLIRCIFVFLLGYTCQGNEWSLYMLFASHFILNRLALICIFNTSDCVIPVACKKGTMFILEIENM